MWCFNLNGLLLTFRPLNGSVSKCHHKNAVVVYANVRIHCSPLVHLKIDIHTMLNGSVKFLLLPWLQCTNKNGCNSADVFEMESVNGSTDLMVFKVIFRDNYYLECNDIWQPIGNLS